MIARPVPQRPSRSRRKHPLFSEIDIPQQSDFCIVGSKSLQLGMSPGSVRDHNQSVLDVLGRVRERVNDTRSIRLEPTFCQERMKELRSLGRSAYNTLGDSFVQEFNQLEQKANECGLSLAIKNSVFPLLWEMLYSGSPRGEMQIDRFWGFHHQIARLQLGVSSAEEELEAGHSFLFCPNRQLQHWQLEHDTLRRLIMPHFHFHVLDDLMPGLSIDPLENVSEQFIDVLSMPELGILHLACHCLPDPNRQGVLFSEIVVSWQAAEIRLKLHELQAARHEFGFKLQPLVFLNACRTMTNPEHLIQGDSFPGGFLGFGASGVIATACDMPDQFAAAFAAKFYENLLRNIRGRSPTMSEALLSTRRFFINSPFYNPLGLAYGLYARRDLRVVWDFNEPEGEDPDELA